jgi:hypothetical protein
MRAVLSAIAIAVALVATAAADGTSSIGYESVDAALKALRQDPAAHISVENGWTIVSTTENGNMVLWSFTPAGHPAYPAAVKRELLKRDGAIYIRMTALCEATQSDCDALIEGFKKLNEQMSKAVRGGT